MAKVAACARMSKSCHCALAAWLALGMALAARPAAAQTLPDALSLAYRHSPRLDAERARLRAVDEEVAKARSGYQPSLTATAFVGAQRTDTRPFDSGDGATRPSGSAVTLTQSLFSGFRTVNGVLEAEAGVHGGRQQLRQLEQTVLLETVTAYLDVGRDQTVVRLRERLVAMLTREVGVVQARVALQEATSTDLAQVRSRRAGATAELETARGNLQLSRATFERVVGQSPGQLTAPAPLSQLLPTSLDAAIAVGGRENPGFVAALYREQAARHGVDRIRGELLPEVRLEAGYTRDFDSSRTTQETEVASVKGRITIPLYTGGEVQARVRQAKHTHISRLDEIEQSRFDVRAQVAGAWAQLAAARAALDSIKLQVQSSRSALGGVRAELQAGWRTVLDVLNAEQESVNAEVGEAAARRNLVLASYGLLAAVGRFTIEHIGTDQPVFEAAAPVATRERNRLGTAIAPDRAPASPKLATAGIGGLGTPRIKLPPRQSKMAATVAKPVQSTAPGLRGSLQ